MHEAADVLYQDASGRFSVLVTQAAIASMVSVSAAAAQRETGGILIGRLTGNGSTAVVMEATSKPGGSRSGWFWFVRGTRGLTQLLEQRWRQGQHYLGEWHYHPNVSPEPSARDLQTMAAIARDGRYQCREPVLAIIGGHPPTRWRLSVVVSPTGEPPQALTAIAA
ncbi:Mov34/MPN/PAD-1 family protein [Roseomonas sp. 18066]|uniref:Mov34/MPN/PAD-1 family protein n=1 Tax=Roseomonas sp. 18066 TaxID=2681412 RepID=UPI001359C685|nr:Mov34/MPN/PAD-1 family protein [Roseomonas sp. 18066]